MADHRPFLSELQRRNVLRAAVLYIGAVWALAQGISQLSGPFGLPDWLTRWFVIACAIGFPFWVAFGWFYEFTPEGFKRDSEIAPDAPVRQSAARKLDFAIIGVLVLVVVLLASGYFVHRDAATAAASADTPFDPPADSLVVLPFKNLDSDARQQYFSDGITEELTGALGQNPGLSVIAWESAAKFRGVDVQPAVIGRQLNVANILHGSILREGEQVRIHADLVNTVTGYEIWSAHYDSAFKDIFKVQDEVSAAIAGALKVKFAQADLAASGTANPEAHELVLKGRSLMDHFTAASLVGARKDFEQAIALDPDYADAHALLSRTLLDLTERSDLPLKATLPAIRAEAEKATALDPHDADAWVALGGAMAESTPPRVAEARADFRQALALDPSNVGAHSDLGTLLPLGSALAEDARATGLDPANETAWNNFAVNAQDLGDWAREIKAAEALVKLDPKVVDSAFYLAFAQQQLHEYAAAVAAFDRVKPETPLDQEQVDAGRLVYRALGDSALRPQARAAVRALARHAANQDVAGNLLQLDLALGATTAALDLLENSCPADPVACNDLAVNPMYAALRGVPRFDGLARKYTTVAVQ